MNKENLKSGIAVKLTLETMRAQRLKVELEKTRRRLKEMRTVATIGWASAGIVTLIHWSTALWVALR